MSAASKACQQIEKHVSRSVLVKKADEMSMATSLPVFKKIKSQFTVRVQIMSSTRLFYAKSSKK